MISPVNDDELKKLIDDRIKVFFQRSGFTQKKVTDTPTEGLAIVNRSYVNLYGSIAGAPTSSVVGQRYFATDLNYLVVKNSNYRWVNGTGSIVG